MGKEGKNFPSGEHLRPRTSGERKYNFLLELLRGCDWPTVHRKVMVQGSTEEGLRTRTCRTL